MIPVPGGVGVWLVTGVTDMRRGMNTLALQVQEGLGRDPHAGDLYVFRARRGELLKVLWHDGVGVSLYTKRVERADSHGRRRWAEQCRSAPPSSATLWGMNRCAPADRAMKTIDSDRAMKTIDSARAEVGALEAALAASEAWAAAAEPAALDARQSPNRWASVTARPRPFVCSSSVRAAQALCQSSTRR